MTDTELGLAAAEPDPLAEPDPAAPYGRTEDGTALDRQGRRAPYGLTKSGQRKHHPGKRRAKQPAQRGPGGRSSVTAKRRRGLIELTEPLKGVCLGLGARLDDDRLLAEAVTIDMHAEPVAAAIADYCEEHDRLAATVDRIIELGPGALLGFTLTAFVAQTARNFGAVPPQVASMLGGTAEPSDLAEVARRSIPVAEMAPTNGAEPVAPPAG